MASENKIDVSGLTNVPETMFVPLYGKAKETRREGGIIKDEKAVEIVNSVNYDFTRIDRDWKVMLAMAIRTFLFDSILKDLYEKTGGKLVVVNLGAGLDTREVRFPDIKWYQLDLPESIAIRKTFFADSKATLITKSVLDFTWLDDIKEKEHVLFIAEGLFIYFTEEEVKSILNHIAAHFTHSYIAFNTIHKRVVGKKGTGAVDTTKAPFKWGITSPKEVLGWKLPWKERNVFYPLDHFRKRWAGYGGLGMV